MYPEYAKGIGNNITALTVNSAHDLTTLSEIKMRSFKVDKSKMGTPGVREAKTLTERGKKRCKKCGKELQNSQRPDLCTRCEAEKNVQRRKN